MTPHSLHCTPKLLPMLLPDWVMAQCDRTTLERVGTRAAAETGGLARLLLLLWCNRLGCTQWRKGRHMKAETQSQRRRGSSLAPGPTENNQLALPLWPASSPNGEWLGGCPGKGGGGGGGGGTGAVIPQSHAGGAADLLVAVRAQGLPGLAPHQALQHLALPVRPPLRPAPASLPPPPHSLQGTHVPAFFPSEKLHQPSYQRPGPGHSTRHAHS